MNILDNEIVYLNTLLDKYYKKNTNINNPPLINTDIYIYNKLFMLSILQYIVIYSYKFLTHINESFINILYSSWTELENIFTCKYIDNYLIFKDNKIIFSTEYTSIDDVVVNKYFINNIIGFTKMLYDIDASFETQDDIYNSILSIQVLFKNNIKNVINIVSCIVIFCSYGIINFETILKQNTPKFDSYAYIQNYIIYYNNFLKYIQQYEYSQTGGYYNKYIKYKSKYISLLKKYKHI